MNPQIRKYIEEEVADMLRERRNNIEEAANKIIERILDPSYKPSKKSLPRMSTKVESYVDFIDKYQSTVYRLVYETLQTAETPLSRAEIANRAGLRMSTVCGRVAELIEAGAISVVDTKIDSDSNKRVEVLTTNFKQ